jgi:hypothetical protein
MTTCALYLYPDTWSWLPLSIMMVYVMTNRNIKNSRESTKIIEKNAQQGIYPFYISFFYRDISTVVANIVIFGSEKWK